MSIRLLVLFLCLSGCREAVAQFTVPEAFKQRHGGSKAAGKFIEYGRWDMVGAYLDGFDAYVLGEASQPQTSRFPDSYKSGYRDAEVTSRAAYRAGYNDGVYKKAPRVKAEPRPVYERGYADGAKEEARLHPPPKTAEAEPRKVDEKIPPESGAEGLASPREDATSRDRQLEKAGEAAITPPVEEPVAKVLPPVQAPPVAEEPAIEPESSESKPGVSWPILILGLIVAFPVGVVVIYKLVNRIFPDPPLASDDDDLTLDLDESFVAALTDLIHHGVESARMTPEELYLHVLSRGWQNGDGEVPKVRLADQLKRYPHLARYLEHWNTPEYWATVVDGLMFLGKMCRTSSEADGGDAGAWSWCCVPPSWPHFFRGPQTKSVDWPTDIALHCTVGHPEYLVVRAVTAEGFMELLDVPNRLGALAHKETNHDGFRLIDYFLDLTRESYPKTTAAKVRLILHESRHLLQAVLQLPRSGGEANDDPLCPEELDARYYQEIVYAIFNLSDSGTSRGLPFSWRAWSWLELLISSVDHQQYIGQELDQEGRAAEEAKAIRDLDELRLYLEEFVGDARYEAFTETCLAKLSFFSNLFSIRRLLFLDQSRPEQLIECLHRIQSSRLPFAHRYYEALAAEYRGYLFNRLARHADDSAKEMLAAKAVEEFLEAFRLRGSSRLWKYVGQTIAETYPRNIFHVFVTGEFYIGQCKDSLQAALSDLVMREGFRGNLHELPLRSDVLEWLGGIPCFDKDPEYIGREVGTGLLVATHGESTLIIDYVCGTLSLLQAMPDYKAGFKNVGNSLKYGDIYKMKFSDEDKSYIAAFYAAGHIALMRLNSDAGRTDFLKGESPEIGKMTYDAAAGEIEVYRKLVRQHLPQSPLAASSP